MRLRERELPLDPEIERELDAIDRALTGRPVNPQLEDLALLAAEIRTERPEPTAEAEAHLDRLAAEGFPPPRLRSPGPRLSPNVGRLRRAPAQGRAPPDPVFSAAAVFAIAVGLGISESGVFEWRRWRCPPQRRRAGSDRSTPEQPPSPGAHRATAPSVSASSSGRAGSCPARPRRSPGRPSSRRCRCGTRAAPAGPQRRPRAGDRTR